MNKRIKRVIAMALVLGTFSSVAPNQYFSLLTTKAYASSDDDYGINGLSVAKVDSSDDENNDDTELTMYTDSDYSNSDVFSQKEYEYYVRTGADSIKIKVDKAYGYTYKIFKSGSSEAYSSSDELDLKSGDNTFYVRTYETGDYDSKNVEKNQIRCYEVHVEKKSSSSINLKNISLSDGDISFSKNTSSYNVEVGSDVSDVKITANPEDDDYTVKIDDTKVTSDDNFRKTVSLNKGKNTIKIQVGDGNDSTKTYTLNIYRGTTAEASKATVEYGPSDYNQSSVYLDDLKLNNGDINLNFNKNVSIYNVKVDSDIEEMYVTAAPEKSSYKVDVNGKILTEDKDYEAKLSNLVTGENAFTIKVTDADGNSRKYTLNIYRGVEIAKQSTTTAEVNANQWVQVAGRWQYNDKNGNPIKSQLFYDDNYKKTYFLNAQGYLDSGWQSLDRKFYYADGSGAVQKGWLNIGPNWYHLDVTTGEMNTGWLQDGAKWYYLDQTTGIMAHDTNIGQYKLGSDGAWIE